MCTVLFLPARPQAATPSWDQWLCVSSWAAGGSSPSLCVRPTRLTWPPTSPCHAWTMLSGKAQYLHLSFSFPHIDPIQVKCTWFPSCRASTQQGISCLHLIMSCYSVVLYSECQKHRSCNFCLNVRILTVWVEHSVIKIHIHINDVQGSFFFFFLFFFRPWFNLLSPIPSLVWYVYLLKYCLNMYLTYWNNNLAF